MWYHSIGFLLILCGIIPLVFFLLAVVASHLSFGITSLTMLLAHLWLSIDLRPCMPVFITRTSRGGEGGDTTPARFKTKIRRD